MTSSARAPSEAISSRLPWRASPYGGFRIVVAATLHASRGGPALARVVSGGEPLPKGCWLRFAVREACGVGFHDKKYKIYWRVTNTDQEAHDDRCLRGGFELAKSASAHWEGLKYRGVHAAQAFVVRRNDDTLVAQSEPFSVRVEPR